MPLSDEEHFQVVNKLGAYMEKMTPQEIPSFVYQLLCLCSTRNSRCIFLRLQNYFGARIYEIMPPQNDNNSDNTDMDLIGILYNPFTAFRDAGGYVLFLVKLEIVKVAVLNYFW